MVFRLLSKIFRRNEVDCKETRRSSSDYLDETLPPRKLAAIQNHLSNCGPCRAFVDTLASTIGILSRFPRVIPPSSFKESLMDKIRRDR
ncbi:MAG: zf-HC2 domain-containing protein [Chloroflexi bacterium]|nr:zf-HC2 domain-containing protein [Chloroflexota bacterium]